MEPEAGTNGNGEAWEVEPGLRIVGVCGSLSAVGATKSALSVALRGAAEFDVETDLIELRDYDLPFCGAMPEDDYPEARTRPHVAHYRQRGKRQGRGYQASCFRQHLYPPRVPKPHRYFVVRQVGATRG